MPLVALEIWLEVSLGIRAVRVELRRPTVLISSRRVSQSRCTGGSLHRGVQILFIGIDGRDTLGIGGLVEGWAGAELAGQLHGGLQQVVLDRLEGAVGQGQTGTIGVAGTVFAR